MFLKMDTFFQWHDFNTLLSRSYIKRFVRYNLYDSQSVFQFSLLLHYHTSCSYSVHKSCSYRVFSLQEFMQNDSKTSCRGSYYCADFREKKSKKKKKKTICVKPEFKRRKNLEYY